MNYFEYKSQLIKQAALTNTPISGEFELNARCNFKCQMCYVTHQINPIELSTNQWKKIFDDAVKEGLLFALLTGGEVLARSDFKELYSYLFDKAVKIMIFTNGSLITQEIIDLFKTRPIELVVITVYGSSNQVYEEVTQIKNGFALVDKGIDLLIKNNIPFILRTSPIRPLYNDLDNIINYVKSKNKDLHYYLYIGPTRKKEDRHLNFRLGAKELIDFEQRIKKAFGVKENQKEEINTSFRTCMALKSGYFINHKGEMQACATAYTPKRSILDVSLRQGFDELVNEFKQIETCEDCQNCSLANICLQCYARRLGEGEVHKCSNYLRTIALNKRSLQDEKI